MPDIFDLLRKWWKQILAAMIVSVVAIGILVFLKPREYLSTTTAVPASSFAADKSTVFNENVQTLYSTLGNPDDLDRVVGTAGLDTVYLAVADQFNLWDHYKTKDKSRVKAASCLRKHSKVMKSEYGELKVKVWATDKELAPQLANAILDKLAAIHRDLYGAANKAALDGLIAGKNKLQQPDSVGKSAHINRVQQYEKLIAEYQLMVDSKPPALITVEKARAAEWPDRPRRKQVLAATAVLSLLFSLFAVLLLERRKILRL